MPADELLSTLSERMAATEGENDDRDQQQQQQQQQQHRRHPSPPLPQGEDAVKGRTRHSRRIPFWLWFAIAKSLGIRMHPGDRPVASAVLHVLTLAAGAAMVFTNAFFAGYDIMSVHSATDILDGSVTVLMSLLYCGVGVYSHRLAYRLFVHPKFVRKLRLHSKTIMKLNAAIVVFLVISIFVVVQNLSFTRYLYGWRDEHTGQKNSTATEDSAGGEENASEKNGTIPDIDMNPCQKINVPLPVCWSFFFAHLVFSVLFLFWTVLVAVVLTSVARTHTIEIRRFMCELYFDAQILDRKFRRSLAAAASREMKDNLRQYHWVDSDNVDSLFNNPSSSSSASSASPSEDRQQQQQQQQSPRSSGNNKTIELRQQGRTTEKTENSIEEEEEEESVGGGIGNVSLALKDEDETSSAGERPTVKRFHRLSEEREAGGAEDMLEDGAGGGGGVGGSGVEDEDEDTPIVAHLMSEQEIMLKYWRLVSSTKLTSLAFQRWMCVMTVSVLFWSAMRMVYWLSHTPSMYGVLSFVLPLLLLPLLSSAYAEVNYEGIKVIQAIMPTPERVHMFQYMYGMPVQLTCYGHRISYGTMGTVLAAIMAAFASKILLQEMNRIIIK